MSAAGKEPERSMSQKSKRLATGWKESFNCGG